jgi:hypothetical protein
MATGQHTIGIMDPFGLSFRYSLERLLAFYAPKIHYGGKTHTVTTARETNRAYDTRAARASYEAIVNRGDQWHPQHTSLSVLTAPHTYTLNDMLSFQAVNKNTAYGQMADLGLHVPPTWAIPTYRNPEDARGFGEPIANFNEHVHVDLHKIGQAVGFPAFLKPQSGGGWRGVMRVNSLQELYEAYPRSGGVPVNLQRAIDYREFVRTVGIGPQMIPMHYNASAQYSHDRYLRSEQQAVEFEFISGQERDELAKIAKVINAFYGWDHNSCEALIGKQDGVCYPIDFANVSPDSKLISLHFFFPELVKAMLRWLIFVVVTGRKKPVAFNYHWERFWAVRDEARQKGLGYRQTLDRYAALADEHFQTEELEHFVSKYMSDFDERAYQWFAGQELDQILEAEVNWIFKLEHERPGKLAHYRGIHQFWLHCEKDRLGVRQR